MVKTTVGLYFICLFLFSGSLRSQEINKKELAEQVKKELAFGPMLKFLNINYLRFYEEIND